MTIEAAASEVSYAGNDVTVVFAIPFAFDTSADLKVIRTSSAGVPEVLTTGFSVTGGSGSTGSLTMATAPATGETLTILDDPAQTQPTDYTDNDAFPAETHEDALDRVTRIAKRVSQRVNLALRFADGDPARGALAEIPTVAARRGKWMRFADSAIAPLEVADLATAGVTLSASVIGALLWAQTAAEASAGVTPSNYAYEPGDVRRYGADPLGVADSSAAIQQAINVGKAVLFYDGSYLANNLTQSADYQRFFAFGNVRIIKNANGALLTCAGDEVELQGIAFRGDASSPTYTGDGVVMTGENPRIINCGARWFSGRALKCTGNGAQIVGTCDIYQTTDSSGTGYDIELGVSGTATLYHRVLGVKSSQSTGGIKMTDTGSASVEASQFGKLTISAGTTPSGVNGGNIFGNRILGNISVGLSSAAFAANTIGAVTVTFESGTSGHAFDESNVVAVGATLTDDSTASNIVDLRQVAPQAYTPTWTAASVNPTLGDGTLVGLASKRGRVVTVQLRLIAGTTTTFGTGVWYFSLPFVPSTTQQAVGAAHAVDSGTTNVVGVCETLTDGTARMQVYFDAANAAGAAVPFTWASGDVLVATLTYFV